MSTHKEESVARESRLFSEDTDEYKDERRQSENTHDHLTTRHYASYIFSPLGSLIDLSMKNICFELF